MTRQDYIKEAFKLAVETVEENMAKDTGKNCKLDEKVRAVADLFFELGFQAGEDYDRRTVTGSKN
jgi:hypothetical protein